MTPYTPGQKPLQDREPDYTHALHAKACGEAAKARKTLVTHVLVQKGPIVYCGVIKAPWTTPDGKDCWTVETLWPEKCRFTVSCKNVIECKSEKCSCLDDVGGKRSATAASREQAKND